MTNDEPDILVQRFVDGDLSDAEVKKALHRIADDAEARDLLQFELRMTKDLAATRASQPPPDFADRTMEAVAREPAPGEAPTSPWEPLRSLWDRLTGPVTLRVRPVSAVVTALLLGIVAWTMWPTASIRLETGPQTASEAPGKTQQAVQQTSPPAPEQDGTVWIRFLYNTNSDVDSVAVAGDFSEWEPVPLSPRTVDGETVWTGLVPVTRGEHEYQFLINGDQWVTDPLAPVKRSDGFGAKNAVLNI